MTDFQITGNAVRFEIRPEDKELVVYNLLTEQPELIVNLLDPTQWGPKHPDCENSEITLESLVIVLWDASTGRPVHGEVEELLAHLDALVPDHRLN